MTEILYKLDINNRVKKGFAYGWSVLANQNGLIFACAGGTHCILFKVREDRIDDARRDGGRWDPTYGKDWIEFCVYRRSGVAVDWREAMNRWAKISYQDNLTA